MTLDPIRVLQRVRDEYRDYLVTEFRARDAELRRALEARLARAMEDRARAHGSPDPEHAFLHQSDAIALLLGDAPTPLVVTTETGSGKTEAFLLPVIQNALQDAARFNT